MVLLPLFSEFHCIYIKMDIKFLATTRQPRLNEILGPAPTVWLDRRAGRLTEVHSTAQLIAIFVRVDRPLYLMMRSITFLRSTDITARSACYL
jgi:hypothetical protein